MKGDLFEYATVRIVPLVEREEFVNAGVILFCKQQKFLKMKIDVNESKLRPLRSTIDVQHIKEQLSAFDKICNGTPDSGEIGSLPQAERFRWLTGSRSTIIQFSKVHPGLCDNAAAKLDELFDTMVR
jgi:hypothetical protein